MVDLSERDEFDLRNEMSFASLRFEGMLKITTEKRKSIFFFKRKINLSIKAKITTNTPL